MASKIEKMRQKQAREREQFELKKKELEEEMNKGKINLKTIQNGLKGNEINVGNILTAETSTSTSSTVGTIKKVSHTHTPSAAMAASSGVDRTSFGGGVGGGGVAMSSSGDVVFPVPAGPRVSDWSYTGDIDSIPPSIKSLVTYEIVRLLGRGAFGEVNLVKNLEDNKLYACKTIYCEKEEYLTESLKEVCFLRANRHPAIIDVHDCFITTQPRVLYMVMSYCETSSISKFISLSKKSSSTVPESKIQNWIVQILLALQFLHGRGVLHRDLKADNIMLMDGGDFVKVVDFGLAVNLTEVKPMATAEAGTPYYMSPEIIKNEPYSFPADCWSLGVVLHEMLRLDLPFKGQHTKDFVKAVIGQDPPAVPNTFSSDIVNLSLALLEKNPSKRMTATEALQVPFLMTKANSFVSGYRPKALQDSIRRCYVKILTKQMSAISDAMLTSPNATPRTAAVKKTIETETLKFPAIATKPEDPVTKSKQNEIFLPVIESSSKSEPVLISSFEGEDPSHKFVRNEYPSFNDSASDLAVPSFDNSSTDVLSLKNSVSKDKIDTDGIVASTADIVIATSHSMDERHDSPFNDQPAEVLVAISNSRPSSSSGSVSFPSRPVAGSSRPSSSSSNSPLNRRAKDSSVPDVE